MSRTSWFVVAALFGAGCTYQGAPVPVLGETSFLEGQWEGTYSSERSGRTGSILFQLKAGTDSAYGDVVMVPGQLESMRVSTMPDIPVASRKLARALRISFVRCEEGQVTGRLDPYEDPDTGERIYTTFEGRLRGDTFRGTFLTFYPGSNHQLGGKWSVKRTKH
jgi:hypothetical protein